ncbi:long-subunit fatty acid transport protein [Myroides indicus]|uniref:Long-subunit fatty acid transport protein n=2 Tax=Myroides indicus TaxID=1323422 RepID=A0A4R7ES36_9FLAO|nr:long-subunit fatty acid transport protein [Myroides indicus]
MLYINIQLKMINKIFLSISLLFGVSAFAQQGTASPYSFYGIGDINNNGTNEYRAMAGTSVYTDSIHINLQNPASFGKLKLTTFALGATAKYYDFTSGGESDKSQRQSLDYLTLGFPIADKVGVVFGLQPYSNIGYKTNTTTSNESNQLFANTFNGSGGINKTFLGIGYEINSRLQIGIDASYYFGHTDNTTAVQMIDNGSGVSLLTSTNEIRRIDYKGFGLRMAVQYAGQIKGLDYQTNLTYSPETKFTADNLTRLDVVNLTNGYIIDRKETVNASEKITNPQVYSLGAGLGKNLKWFVSAQFTYTENSKLKNSWNSSQYSSFEDSKRFSVGGFYIPKYNSFTSYFDRIVYRAGLRYENTGLVLNNQSINDFGVTAGFGFPVGRNFTNLNLGVEYGQRGTTSKNLVRENYFNITIGLSFNDFWFKKRRFE